VACGDSVADQNGNGDGNGTEQGLTVETVTTGLASPSFVTWAPGDDRLYIVELPGRVRIFADGAFLAQPFLDIRSIVSSGGERGLFSITFHPQYEQNGLFFVSFTDSNGNSRIARYQVSADRSVADPGSAKEILSATQPFGNHNGGQIAFGPDGMLYIAFGDGGSGGDPRGNGQNRGTLLGSMLRIDVDAGDPYAIPPDNPFVNDSGARPETWAYGLRNPWRFSFDRTTGDLYIADVGQSDWEEVNVVPSDSAGINYGWNRMEGRHCYASASCSSAGLSLPLFEYASSGGACSVTGGYVYRGSALPDIQGHYFFADYCEGRLRSFRAQGDQAADVRTWDVGRLGSVTSFGEDAAGEVYIVTAEGVLYRLN
jgi:glucose/arabinose dehydrogenase